MIYEESHLSRRIIGNLDAGQPLIETIKDICIDKRVTYAQIQLAGRLDTVELVMLDPATSKWETVLKSTSEFEIVTCNAQILTVHDAPVVEIALLLAAKGPATQQLIFGHVKDATVVQMSFTIDAPADLSLQHKLNQGKQTYDIDTINTLDLPQEHATPPLNPKKSAENALPSTPTSRNDSKKGREPLSWANAADMSSKIKPKPTFEPPAQPVEEDVTPEDIYSKIDLEEPIPSPGDIILHKDLGRCCIVRMEGDEFAHVRIPRGKIRKLNLELLTLKYVEPVPNGGSLFKASKRRDN